MSALQHWRNDLTRSGASVCNGEIAIRSASVLSVSDGERVKKGRDRVQSQQRFGRFLPRLERPLRKRFIRRPRISRAPLDLPTGRRLHQRCQEEQSAHPGFALAHSSVGHPAPPPDSGVGVQHRLVAKSSVPRERESGQKTHSTCPMFPTLF
jgi:hypothetical protein